MAAYPCIVQQLLQSQSGDLALHNAIPFEQHMEDFSGLQADITCLNRHSKHQSPGIAKPVMGT